MLLLILGPYQAAFAANKSQHYQQEITLEKAYQDLSSRIYTSLSQTWHDCKRTFRSLKDLNNAIENNRKYDNIALSHCQIQYNLKLIRDNIDDKELFSIFSFLLKHNNKRLADKIYRIARDDTDKPFVSNLSYQYARYFLNKKDWSRVKQYLVDTFNDLSKRDRDFALIMNGIALQKLKDHRKAVLSYKKISESSDFYPIAKLNIAIAYIRQDWWTDAHNEIQDVIYRNKNKVSDEMTNRLYLVLGYSLLRKEFYRDSREAFRNIQLKSMYTNKALLGIALTATNQEDFIGGLNAIKILKKEKAKDLSADESYLLLPYLYEKLGQHLTASASYTDALQYYEARIKEMEGVENQLASIKAKDILARNNNIHIGNNQLSYSDHYPVSYLENARSINQLYSYANIISDKKLKNQLIQLKGKYDELLLKQLKNLSAKRKNHLTSYMNQSRFGLARLYDKNTASIK